MIAKELSQHVLNQQQKIKILDTTAIPTSTPQNTTITSNTTITNTINPMSSQSQQNTVSLNTSRAKLSQIQVKPKSSTIYQSQSLSKTTTLTTSTNSAATTATTTLTTNRLNLSSNEPILTEITRIPTSTFRQPPLALTKSKTEPEPMFSAEIFKAAEAEKLEKLEKLEVLKKLRVLEEPALTKPQGLYTYAVTSSCQLRECFYNNRSLINTSSNSTNQLVYHRSEIENNCGDTKSLNESPGDVLMLDEVDTAGYNTPIETKNTKKNRRMFKDLEFIYNEQQVFKLSRQIW